MLFFDPFKIGMFYIDLNITIVNYIANIIRQRREKIHQGIIQLKTSQGSKVDKMI